ncbi:MAG: hypothetical protein JRN35_08970 [Nitrososphaerota archaeon]|nr:hypothetical protein [Nitrososphaerota archaeon]
METPTFSMSPSDELANWGLAQSFTASAGSWFSCFTVLSNCPGVVSLNLSFLDPSGNPSAVDLDTLLAGLLDNGTGGASNGPNRLSERRERQLFSIRVGTHRQGSRSTGR